MNNLQQHIERLAPCPFCGHDKHCLHILKRGHLDNHDENAIRCAGCGAQGPSGTAPLYIIEEAWNRRAVISNPK